MKKTILVLFLSAAAAFATPLDRKEVSSDAKWLLHLDVTALRQTSVGKYIFSEVLGKKLDEAKKVFPLIGVLAEDVQGITAYGNETSGHDRNGVLIIKTDPEAEKKLETLVQAGMSGVTPGLSAEKLDVKGADIYKINKEFYVQAPHNGHLILSKSRPALDKAYAVISNGGESLAGTKAFTGFGDEDNGFFLIGVAEGLGESMKAFPQAKILQMAEGGRLTLGETAEKLNLRVALKAKDQESSSQMQQVIQGLIALVSLTQTENKELNSLIQTLKIDKDENVVKMSLSFPVTDAIKQIAQKQKE